MALFAPVVKDSTASVNTGLGLLLLFLLYSVNPLVLFGYLVEGPLYLLQFFMAPSALVMLLGVHLLGRRLWLCSGNDYLVNTRLEHYGTRPTR